MQNFQLTFEAIGTHWVIDCCDFVVKKNKLFDLITERIEIFDKTYSRFRKDSLVWKISENKGDYIFPPDSKKLFSLYEQLYKITNGAFTLLVGNILDEAGYDAVYSLIPKKINELPDVSSIYSFEYPKLEVKKPYILDFGGLGKGYLIDILSELLVENSVDSFCIDGGGDIRCQNLKIPMRVGLENPADFKQVIGVIEINNKSICASSGNRRRWANFHHIIDPRTKESPNKILATWVLAKDTLTADAISTCLFLETPEKLGKYFNFEYLILYPDFSIKKSKNFSADLFTNN